MALVKAKSPFNNMTHEGIVVDTEQIYDGLVADTPETARVAKVTLTAAQIKALNTTPQTLVAAAGAGTVIVVERIFGESVGVTAPFDASTNALEFRYTNGSGTKVTADLPNSFIEAGSGSTVYGTVGGIEAALVPVANAPVVAFIPVANPAADTAAGTITLTVVYRVYSV